MIEARGLTKRYGATVAVDNLTFTVPPGRVTGFLGPNGSGKSTTMRLLLQLDRPNAGTTTFNGRSYRSIPHPATEVGALLDAAYAHPSGPPATTSGPSPRRTACAGAGSRRCWPWSG